MGKDKQINIRLSENDLELLQKKAEDAGMTCSNYIRFLIHGDAKSYPEVRRLIAELKREINYIGHNIDQILRRNNSGFYNPKDKDYLTASMQEIMLLLRKAVESFGNQ